MKEYAKSDNPKLLSLDDIKAVVPTALYIDQQGKAFGIGASISMTDGQLATVCKHFGLEFDLGIIYDDNHACYTFQFV